MAIILCLETATTNCSVTLSIDGKAVAIREENNKSYSHSEKLHVFIEEVLREQDLYMADIEAVAVSKGPGSYTGLRIGVSAAKGLCFALDIPLISTLTLEVLAQQVHEKDCFIIPLLDARRMEVYAAVFDATKKQLTDTSAEILTPNSFEGFLNQKRTVFLGDGSSKWKEICSHPNAMFLENKYPSSKEMSLIAEDKFLKNDFEDVAYFEPFYLKEFIIG